MDYDQELPSDLISAIEACRPGSDDARLPETAAILGRASPERVAKLRRAIEASDRAIAVAMRQAPVPESLADRILASLPPVAAGGSSPAVKVAIGEETHPASEFGIRNADFGDVEVAACEEAQPRSRRPSGRLLAAGMAMAASLLLAIVLWPAPETIDLAQAQIQAREFYEADDHSADLLREELPAALPAPANLVVGRRSVTLFDRSGQAYELSGRRGLRGTLYVVPLSSFWGPALSGLPDRPQPHGTMGTTAALWISGGDVYVMVVEGDERAFRSFFAQAFA